MSHRRRSTKAERMAKAKRKIAASERAEGEKKLVMLKAFLHREWRERK